MFYYLATSLEWQNVFAKADCGTADNYFRSLGTQFNDFYNVLREVGEITFHFMSAQEDAFNA